MNVRFALYHNLDSHKQMSAVRYEKYQGHSEPPVSRNKSKFACSAPSKHSFCLLRQNWHKPSEITANGRAKSVEDCWWRAVRCGSIVAKQGAEETSEKSNFHAGSRGWGGAARTPRTERPRAPVQIQRRPRATIKTSKRTRRSKNKYQS